MLLMIMTVITLTVIYNRDQWYKEIEMDVRCPFGELSPE